MNSQMKLFMYTRVYYRLAVDHCSTARSPCHSTAFLFSMDSATLPRILSRRDINDSDTPSGGAHGCMRLFECLLIKYAL